MLIRRTRWASLVAIVLPALLSADQDKNLAPAKEAEQFLRVVRNDRGIPTSMETSVASFTNGKSGDDEVTVDLISAIHIADRDYYEKLNELFVDYDALLYELVAAEGTTPNERPKQSDKHPIAMMQEGLKDLLGLDHQLFVVDYEKKNFVHADMSPQDFAKAMADRGESFVTMFMRMAFEGMKQQGKNGASGGEDIKMLMALLSPDRPLALKRILADQFEQLDTISAGLDGPSGSAILTDRNKRALEVLTRSLDAGKKRIGIFYGAAHMPDMSSRLVDDFDLKRTGTRWLVAWNMASQSEPSEFLKRLEENRKARDRAKKPAPASP